MACRDFEMQISEHYKSQWRRPSYRNGVKCFRISMLLVFLYMALSVHCSHFSCSYLAMVAHFQFMINCAVPVTEILLSVLGSLCCLYFFIWLSVFTALISAVVIWLWSHISSS